MNHTRMLWLLPLVGALLFWLNGWLMPSPTISISMGNEQNLNAYGQGTHLYNFFGWGNPGTEKGKLARRIHPDPIASFLIPNAFYLGSPLELELEMCGCSHSPQPLQLAINGITHTIALDQEWQTYRFTLEQHPSLYNNALYLEWQSNAAPRPLVHRVTLTAGRPAGWLLGGLLLGVILAGVVAIRPISGTEVDSRKDATSAKTGQRPDRLSTFLSVFGIIASAIIGHRLYEVQVLPWTALLGMGGMAALLLTRWCHTFWHRLVLWMLVLWMLALPQLLGTWILDDAFISFRYAQNVIDGHHLTFNPGGELVEGYTNFLWTMIMAVMLLLRLEPIVTAQVLCTTLALLTLIVLYRCAATWWDEQAWSLVPPVLLAVQPSFLLYTVRGSGMETALVTLLSLVALWLLWQTTSFTRGMIAGGVCALVMMTRPDGVLVAVAGGIVLLVRAILVHLGIVIPRSGEEVDSRKDAKSAKIGQRPDSLSTCSPVFDIIPPNEHNEREDTPEEGARRGVGNRLPGALAPLAGVVSGGALLYLPYFLWRWNYYGYLLPNTFYAKTGATVAQVERGVAYSREFFLSHGLRSLVVLLGLSLLTLLIPALRRRTTPGPAIIAWGFVVLTTLYVSLVGGDHFPLGRFFVPVVPPLALLFTHGLKAAVDMRHVLPSLRIPHWLGWLPGVVGIGAVLLLVWMTSTQLPHQDSRDIRGRIWGENYVALKNREVGLWLRQHTPPDTVIATGIAGALPFYAQRVVIDALGLNDVYIAHMHVATIGEGVAGAEKTDPTYILDRQPDIIPHSNVGIFANNERFQQTYSLITVRGPEGGEILLYARRSESMVQ